MMAYAFARFEFFGGKEALFRPLLLGLMIPAMMLIIPQFVLAKYLGLLDSLTGLVVFYVAGIAAAEHLPAARVLRRDPGRARAGDGRRRRRAVARYWRLILPLARPALATATIFTFLASWDEFAWALTIINDPSKHTLPLAIALFQGQNSTSWGLVFAASTIAVIPVIVVFVAFQRQFISGLSSGALKA